MPCFSPGLVWACVMGTPGRWSGTAGVGEQLQNQQQKPPQLVQGVHGAEKTLPGLSSCVTWRNDVIFRGQGTPKRLLGQRDTICSPELGMRV